MMTRATLTPLATGLIAVCAAAQSARPPAVALIYNGHGETLQLSRAARLPYAWQTRPTPPGADTRVCVVDGTGAVLAEVPVSLSLPDPRFCTLGSARKDAVSGAPAGPSFGTPVTLVRVPNLAATARVVLEQRAPEGNWRVLVDTPAGELRRLMNAQPAPPPTVNSLLSGGPDRLEIVILGDGFTKAEEAKFDTDAMQCANYLTGSKEPFWSYANYFNVRTVFRPSAQSGVDHAAPNVIVRDTAYNSLYGIGGFPQCVLPRDGPKGSNGSNTNVAGLTQAIADAATVPGFDRLLFVLINEPNVYGGCAMKDTSFGPWLGRIVYAAGYNGTLKLDVMAHELGHILGGLGDEKPPGNQKTAPVMVLNEPNLEWSLTRPTSPKWNVWLKTLGGPHQGGAGYDYGIWHPKQLCAMNWIANTFCEVCREKLVKQLDRFADPFHSYSPSPATIISARQGEQIKLSVAHHSKWGAAFTWKVDGWTRGSGSNTFVMDTLQYGIGQHTVTATARDRTPWVLNDPNNAMVSTTPVPWTIDLQKALPDLTVTSITLGATKVHAGDSNVPVTVMIKNASIGDVESPFKVELFLGLSEIHSKRNPMLAEKDFQKLGANAIERWDPSVSLPFGLKPGNYVLYAIVDRRERVTEANELNNQGTLSPFALDKPAGCPTKLEFRVPYRVSLDTARLSAAAGGSLQMIVSSPCHAGQWYMVGASVSGTTPGIPLGGGLTLPLNPDPVFAFVYSNVNVWPYGMFLGQLDSDGLAAPLLSPSGGYFGAGNFKLWFASSVWQSSPFAFLAVTNAGVVTIDP